MTVGAAERVGRSAAIAGASELAGMLVVGFPRKHLVVDNLVVKRGAAAGAGAELLGSCRILDLSGAYSGV